jgi:hypothetical protein
MRERYHEAIRETQATGSSNDILQRLSNSFELEIKRIFPDIPSDHPAVMITAGIFVDGLFHPRQFGFLLKPPDYLAQNPKRLEQYKHGIIGLTEWATNRATTSFIRASLPKRLAYPSSVLALMLDNVLVGRPAAPKAYKAMGFVEETAKINGLDFDEAVFEAVFGHDFDELNHLVAQTPNLRARGIDELAEEIGGERMLSKVLGGGKLGFVPEKVRRKMKLALLSLTAGGMFTQPGIAEILPTMGVFMNAYAITNLIKTASNLESAIGSSAFLGLINFYLYYSIVHETMHAYSASADYLGFTPIELAKTN